MTSCMLQNSLGQNILLSSERCSPTSRSLGSRSTPENHALALKNLTIWVITSLVTRLYPYQIKSRQFKPSQFQKLENNCFSLSVWSTSTVTCGKTPLTALTSKKVKHNWKDEHQNFFDAIKRVIGHEVLLTYPYFNAPFLIHNDASKLKIGTFVSQNFKPIAFCSQKINSAQQNYTTT